MISRMIEKVRHYRHRRAVQKLVEAGLQLGQDVNIMPQVHFDHSYPYLIRVGNNCSLGWGTRILAHDATPYSFMGVARIGRVEIRDHCFIGERSLILPGVTIGPKALVAAGSLVTRSVPPNSRVGGSPARVYGTFDDFLQETEADLQDSEVMNFDDLANFLSPDEKERMWRKTEEGVVYCRGYSGRFPFVFNPSGIPPEERLKAYSAK